MERSNKALLAESILKDFSISHAGRRHEAFKGEAKEWLIARLEDFLSDNLAARAAID